MPDFIEIDIRSCASSKNFFKKLTSILIETMGFEKCFADQCLLIKKDDLGMVIICLNIDDICCIGTKKAIGKFKKEIKKYKEWKYTKYIENNKKIKKDQFGVSICCPPKERIGVT